MTSSSADQYVSTPAPPAAALDRAVEKLRAHTDPHISYAIISHDEAAAILAKLEAGERLAESVQTVIHAQTNFTIDIVGIDKMKAQHKALLDYRNPQPAGGGK